uniref:Putative ribonuclease H-like domain-containing protein n=1 Tax=Tanacetum cinerariifolium TaxID=118510 RepID=A0A699I4F0_TANCI|nr:putative ribonuclease H-like domain-containing protein [Tanacetum cinerariifolium]
MSDLQIPLWTRRILRERMGHPKLGLWYPKDSPFDLVAYLDSDYGGATQDHKSTTEGCQFLGRRLILWQCKKQTIVATSTTKAEYVAAVSCCGQVLQIQNQLLDYGSTGFNEFSSNIATALVCLATIRTYNFSKMIFDGMVKNVNNKVLKFLMYLRFLTMCLRMAQFVQITHTQKYVVPFHTKKLFTTLQVNSPSFSGRTIPFFAAMLVYQGEGSGTPIESHQTPSPEAQTPSHTTHPSSSLPPITTTSIPTVTPTETTPIRQYTRRTRIAQSSVPPTVADEPASPQRDVSQGEAWPTDFDFIADQDRATIDKSSTLPHDSAPWVTSSTVVQGTHEVEINQLKERVKQLEEREGVAATNSRDDAPIKGRSMDEGEAATKRVSDYTKEIATVLTLMDAATVLASGVVDVPTSSGSIPTVSTPAEGSVSTGSEEVLTASPVFATATVIDAQVARELEEQLEKEDQRRAEQIAKDAEIARIHAKEELQSMIDGLDSNNETVAKYLEEYRQFSSELPLEKRIELISDLVKYHDNYTKIYKFQSQQRKSWTKKQKRDYYMAVIRNNLGWKVKDFRGMTFEEVEAKFNSVCKQIEDFIPMGSKEEAERIKRKGINLEQERAKKQKSLTGRFTQRNYWKITRLGGSSACYLFFIDLLKHLDREDLNQLWRLLKETLSTRPPTIDWKLYDSCRVHHVAAKDKEIFILVEKDYPLRKGLALVMICYKLQVENFLQMANELFWSTAKVKTVDDEVRVQALIDAKRVTIKESSIRHTLTLDDEDVLKPPLKMNLAALWHQQSSILPQTRSLTSPVDHQLGDMSHHQDIYDNPSLTKKVFANKKRVGTGFSGVITPLFDNMLVPAAEEVELEANRSKFLKSTDLVTRSGTDLATAAGTDLATAAGTDLATAAGTDLATAAGTDLATIAGIDLSTAAGPDLANHFGTRSSRPPMLNKENYVPFLSRLLRYAKSRPNGKLIHNSILNGPYVRRMIPKPGDANHDVNATKTFHEQTDDEL